MQWDHTRSSVFIARSLTAQRAMMGILSEAVRAILPLASKLWLKSDLDMNGRMGGLILNRDTRARGTGCWQNLSLSYIYLTLSS